MEKEKGYLVSNNKSECTGCGTCMNICPKKAIKMIEDEEGFFYPTIDKSKCINCHLCEKICPINRKIKEGNKPKVYYYITTNDEDLLSSSSGGAFIDIVNSFYEKDNTIVYGCIFDKNIKAIHIGYENKKDILKFKKSKYVQSNLLNTYIEAKNNLENGKKVLFSGTPCQISGLKSFLKKKYDNLLCIDLICHGVPSQKLLDYYILSQEKKYNSKLLQLNFREKVKLENGQWDSRNLKMHFQNGKTTIIPAKKSSYLFAFHNRLFYRPSCYKCNFCKIERDSDITIADCWGFENISNEYDVNKGISCIIVNSEKGANILEHMNGKKEELSLNFVINNNESYTNPTKLHKKRANFFNKLNYNNFEKRAFKYSQLPFYKRFKRKIKYLYSKILK